MLWFTTSHKVTEQLEAEAIRLADCYKGQYAPRGDLSVAGWLGKRQTDGAFILTNNGLRYSSKEGQPLFFHPNMAYVRLQRVVRGGHDPLLKAVQAESGDHIVDCTAGFAADAIMLAHAVGPRGSVTALESAREMYILVKEGLRSYTSDWPELQEAMSRIQLQHADYAQWLRSRPDDSCDMIYFDPMFEQPVEASASISPLRALANPAPLDLSSVQEACRVARKRVVLKDRKGSGAFDRLGFSLTGTSSNQVAYGVITL
ncbi:class I SAM-dependent methyltransferase [Xylanibacillus composti]|uniref:SAM-dependent methyltransferase n=1 Tax=Xylanibacillus composti TaxID=1572762 RepID=A0A8J4M1B6_9BACL|nr:class I SAM-dependent methyltransferase [Xylanibacillus composti]GIQ67672.1 hypothetical protein XYCOK13_04960 [Xylanibacillus composti]